MKFCNKRKLRKQFFSQEDTCSPSYLLWSAFRVGDEDSDVDAENGSENAEERKRRELTDELNANKDAHEHKEEQRCSVDPVTVVSVLRYVDGSEQRTPRRHVLLENIIRESTASLKSRDLYNAILASTVVLS